MDILRLLSHWAHANAINQIFNFLRVSHSFAYTHTWLEHPKRGVGSLNPAMRLKKFCAYAHTKIRDDEKLNEFRSDKRGIFGFFNQTKRAVHFWKLSLSWHETCIFLHFIRFLVPMHSSSDPLHLWLLVKFIDFFLVRCEFFNISLPMPPPGHSRREIETAQSTKSTIFYTILFTFHT